jgi:hypothetical protein
VYRRGIEVSLHDQPGPVREQARVSAEQARHAATAIQQPALAHAADAAFIHAMHVSAVWTMLIALSGAVLLVTALRPARKPTVSPGRGRLPREVPGHRRAQGGGESLDRAPRSVIE